MDWIDLAQDRDICEGGGCCECGNGTLGGIKFKKFID